MAFGEQFAELCFGGAERLTMKPRRDVRYAPVHTFAHRFTGTCAVAGVGAPSPTASTRDAVLSSVTVCSRPACAALNRSVSALAFWAASLAWLRLSESP